MSKFPGILFAVLLFAASVLYGAVTPEQLKAQSAPVTAEKYPNADRSEEHTSELQSQR